jgi:hypothetical protein
VSFAVQTFSHHGHETPTAIQRYNTEVDLDRIKVTRRRCHLTVRILPSQGRYTGSIPVSATNYQGVSGGDLPWPAHVGDGFCGLRSDYLLSRRFQGPATQIHHPPLWRSFYLLAPAARHAKTSLVAAGSDLNSKDSVQKNHLRQYAPSLPILDRYRTPISLGCLNMR